MNLKNYTSGYQAEKSISKIELCLQSIGSNEISKEYSSGKAIGLKFKIDGVVVALPANIGKVESCLMNQKKGRRNKLSEKATKEQAERTAWKLLLDWIEVHCSMILIEQVKPKEVFLPYLWNGKTKQKFFQIVEQKGLPLMLEGAEK